MTGLKVGDRVKITGVPPVKPGHTIPKETIRVWRKLAERGRAVTISSIDEYGSPWYNCRFKRKDGTWEYHSLSVNVEDDNWKLMSP